MIGWWFAAFAGAAVLAASMMRYEKARRWVLFFFGIELFLLVQPTALIPIGVLGLGVYILVRRGWTGAAVALAVGLLVGFKAYAASAGTSPLEAIANPLVPLGLSYLAFSAISFAVEARRGTIKPRGLADFFHFLLFFPTVMAGPIKRYGDFRRLDESTATRWRAGLPRIGAGLLKVLVLAWPCQEFVTIFAGQPELRTLDAWLLLYAGAFWLYFDFAGYSDIAIGLARLLGYRVPENFDWPYLRTNIRDFWRHWHMTLTGFLRDYIYIPLGGNRRGFARELLNLSATMMLIALWHGLAPRFALFGIYHVVGLVVFTLWRRARGKPNDNPRPLRRTLAVLFTFHYVAFGWLFFFVDTSGVMRIAAALVGWGG
ncbi:MAG: MBOAT family O-acyltransferase [Candidatus Lernaella stagnicola]|nr:MBOAT family O-acyltransferase [Candidatus Lernaella stagnicola]